MAQSYRIKQLEDRVDFLQSLILKQAGCPPRTNVKLAMQTAKDGTWCVLVKNLPTDLTWKEIQNTVFHLYSKSISRTVKADDGQWILRFKTKEDAQSCATKYNNALVNENRIRCFSKFIQNEKEMTTKSHPELVFKKKRRIFRSNATKGAEGTVKKY